MPQGLQQLFQQRKAFAMRQTWPFPPHDPSQREKTSWMDYWAALEKRASREGWLKAVST